MIIFLFSSSYFSFIFFASGLSSICRCLVQLSGAYARQPRRRDHSPSQDEVIAGLTQELSNLKERYKGLETRDRVPETFPGRVPNPSSETRGDEVLPDAEQMWLTAKSDRARQEVERLSGELSSLKDEKLTLVADLNSAILPKEALVTEKNHLVAEKDVALAEKEHALIDKGRILAEKDKVSLALEKAVSEKDLARGR